MPQTAKVGNYAHDPLIALYNEPNRAVITPVNLAPSTTFVAGQLLGWITSSANDVQTITVSGGAGTFNLSGINPVTGLNVVTAALAFDASAATVQTELRKAANFDAGNVTVTGSAGGPYTVTFIGALAACPVPVLAQGALGATAVATVAHTTLGRTLATFGKYSSAVVAVPVAPTVTGTGSGSGWGAGTHLVQITAVNAQGETTPSIATKITLTAAQLIRVAAQASLGTSVTSINIYVDGVLLGSAAVTTGTSAQADIDNVAPAVAGNPPATNTAYTIPNGAGTQTAKCVLKYACNTDSSGNVSFSSNMATGQWGDNYPANSAIFAGIVDTAKLTGLDAKAVTDLGGRLWYGTITAGALAIV